MSTDAKTDAAQHTEAHHSSFLAHHFHSPIQQFEAGKLGMWIFLLTEILLFGGLFCAYAVYRANRAEIFHFAYSQKWLDIRIGAINTLVLLLSSLTMAWAVRCAQLGRQKGLVVLLSVTLACGAIFLANKYVEYKHKWEEKLLPGKYFHPEKLAEHSGAKPALSALAGPGEIAGVPPVASGSETRSQQGENPLQQGENMPASGAERPPAPQEPVVSGMASHDSGNHTPPQYVAIFFGIYFALTGLHALHVVAGMGAIAWVLYRAWLGHFGPSYFGPVDYVGLYWHLVDIIWIYLFPLLYLVP